MDAGLALIDWAVVALYALFAVALGLWFARRASTSVESFFAGGRRFSWWLAGTSMVATTFAADTPLAVTGIVAGGGIAGNWIWWCWGVAHLTTAFFFARLWRRSGVLTDAEVTELRYGGRPAAALRAFKAVYSGVFLNCLTMAWVIAAMVKISRAFFDVEPWVVIAACVAVSIVYTTLGGLASVAITDLVQFTLGMAGALLLAGFVLAHFGGIGPRHPAPGGGEPGLLPALAASLEDGERGLDEVLAFLPGRNHPTMSLVYFFALLSFGWWKWAEGSGYIVQRLAAARDEGQARGAAVWFAMAHNALRPWPWLLVGLAALALYPQLGSEPRAALVGRLPGGGEVSARPARLEVAGGGTLEIAGLPPGWRVAVAGVEARIEPLPGGARAHFGRLAAGGVAALELTGPGGETVEIAGLALDLGDREMAYPLLMRRFLPPGLLGLAVASLLAAFMSTIDTHVNWGASYLVQDVYRRFLRPAASEREAVAASRAAIVLMAALAGLAALAVHSIAEVWLFLITLGAGLGSVSAARWYWWRVTAWAELAAVSVSTVLALGLLAFCTPTLFGGPNPWFVFEIERWVQIPLLAVASLAAWVPVALWGPANEPAALARFVARVDPPGPGWREARRRLGAPAAGSRVPGADPAGFAAGLVALFGALFGLGFLILGPRGPGVALCLAAAAALAYVVRGGRAARPPIG